MIILSFVLLPATFVYISCPVIIRGASQGVATGGLIVFVLLFISSLLLGRLWCGWLCPGGGLQEIYILLNDKNVRTGRMNLLKYPIFLFILFIPLISAIRSAGGLKTIDLFYYTDQGISIAQQGSYTIFFVQIAFFHRLCPASRQACLLPLLLPDRRDSHHRKEDPRPLPLACAATLIRCRPLFELQKVLGNMSHEP